MLPGRILIKMRNGSRKEEVRVSHQTWRIECWNKQWLEICVKGGKWGLHWLLGIKVPTCHPLFTTMAIQWRAFHPLSVTSLLLPPYNQATEE
ncbi:hypothetical protein OPV22_008729 [Ensete ventricosum]|uniref:Uncharacterized protein n=1 Tax=Ensete ventricosum TaxID=4639 RepID=A0AAV8RCY3_ENSVE|nr:hypothetical protein OPV22_008729 [Ensete ventricosum]